MNKNTKVCVLGLGYIGLPTATVLANKGYKVIGVDPNINVINVLKKGRIHISEPKLEQKFQKALKENKLSFSIKPSNADIFIICVPTPFKEDGTHSPDLTFVKNAIKSIIDFIKVNALIIIESTIPVGTTEEIFKLIDSQFREEFYIAHCPERVLPGKILKEIIENDRVVGGIRPRDTEIAANFYKSFVTVTVLFCLMY